MHSTWMTALVLSLAAAPAAAYTSFQTECSLPAEPVNYVSAPNTRSTFDIVWSSFATILICTYTVLHLNVPEQRNGRDPGLLGDFKWMMMSFAQSIFWFIVTLIAPELYTTMAISDFVRAQSLQRKFRHALSEEAFATWTMTHMYFANMGGFAVRVFVPDTGSRASSVRGSSVESGSSAGPATQPSFLWHLRGRHILRLIDIGWLESATFVLEDEINDRAKNNMLAKIITVTQVGYFSLGVFSRTSRGLPMTLLELSTLSYAAVSIVAWALQFQKPKAVNTVMILKELYPDDPQVSQVSDILIGKRSDMQTLYDKMGQSNAVTNRPRKLRVSKWILALTSACYGAIHIAGWGFAFPSLVDKWLWRSASIMASISLTIPLLILSSAEFAPDVLRDSLGFLGTLCLTAEVPTYFLARLVLMVEMVRCLFYLPPEAFVQNWTANLPGIG